MQKTFFERKVTSIKHWQNRVYLETDRPENLNQMFNERFVNQKRGSELFNALCMTLKEKGGRPQGSKNKPKKIEAGNARWKPQWKTMLQISRELGKI